MRYTSAAILLAGLISHCQATPVARADKPPYFILIGDSTVAVNGGWGDGFLSYVADPASGINSGVSGSTTVSWKSNGRWDDLLETVGTNSADYEPIVTIQFGHNDQKVLTLEEYEQNLEGMATEIQEAGGTPVCHSPLYPCIRLCCSST